MIFLAGDIGGTHTRLLLGETHADGWRPLARAVYPSDQFEHLDDILRLFLETERQTPEIMVLAVAGPVHGERVRITNLPWILDAGCLRDAFSVRRVILLNDFEAQGHALPTLPAGDLVTLQNGQPEPNGVRALIGAGTGLGMAQVISCGEGWRVVPGEGGHVDFSPRNETEVELWRHLRKSLGRVSVENLVSGPGIERIYQYLCRQDDRASERVDAAAISEAALANPVGREREALRLFVQIYGAVAGNLALLTLPRGGLFVAGGIAPKIRPLLEQEGFMASFLDKAPMQELLQRIPVHLICNEDIGVLGAAAVAAQPERFGFERLT